MSLNEHIDLSEIARVCERYDVARLRVFGSVLTDKFDPQRSDIDFLVEFKPGAVRTFAAFFDLVNELERIVGRPVDLIDVNTLKNPYFTRSALSTAQDVYAA